jgi:hypothetical protein
MTFSNFDEHTEPLFKINGLLKLNDLIFLYNSLFMYDFYNNKLPLSFENFFLPVKLKHSYNTRLASKNSYSLPLIRTNYGKLSIRFQGPKIWNDLDDEMKMFSRFKFKKSIINNRLNLY